MAETGFSVYLGTEAVKTEEVIEKAAKAGASYLFTSLNITEEKVEKQERLLRIAAASKEKSLNLIVDINHATQDIMKLKLDNIYFRIDDGLSREEIMKVSRENRIVLNASTVTAEDLEYFRREDADFSRMLSLHNFYPKRFTGISREYLKEQNMKYRKYGIRTMAFVPGDEMRGPVYEGLPTVEEHRNRRFLTSCLDLLSLHTDIVMVGDIDICDEKWDEIGYIARGIVPLRNEGNILKGEVFHDREDFSEYVVRFTGRGKSRSEFSGYMSEKLKECGIASEILGELHERNGSFIRKGDILLSGSEYMRYEGEVEIALKDLGEDSRRYIISRVIEEDMELLDYIQVCKKVIFI